MPISHVCGNPSCLQNLVALKRCNGCEEAWYCNSACQRSHWVEHIFKCKPRRPITTADHLALAVHRSIWPADDETCRDYGFARSPEEDWRRNVLDLWTVLLRDMKVNPQTVHKWRLDGILLQEIHRAFSQTTEFSGSHVYAWFMENQDFLDPASAPPDATENYLDRSFMISGWALSGGSPHDTHDEIMAKISRLPRDMASCHLLYGMVLDDCSPTPETPLWLLFGFCAARLDGGMETCHLYRQLIMTCTFQEFFRAFITSSLTSLFRSYGLVINRYMEDVLSTSPRQFNSVWLLKQYVFESMVKEDGEGRGPSRRVSVDYGFINCRDEEELLELRDVYALFFCRKDSDPLRLHEACMLGRLYEFFKSLIKLSPKSRYVRLFKNPYGAKSR